MISLIVCSSTFEHLLKVSWCGWLVDAEAYVTWAADSNAGRRTASWAPHAGAETVTFDRVIIPASRGLSISECTALAPHYDLGTLRPLSSNDAALEAFDLQRSMAHKAVTSALEKVAASRVRIPGTHFRHVRVSLLLKRFHTTRVALPAYILAYRYRSRIYRVVVHGQDPQIIFGVLPRSTARVSLFVAGLAGTLIVLMALFAKYVLRW